MSSSSEYSMQYEKKEGQNEIGSLKLCHRGFSFLRPWPQEDKLGRKDCKIRSSHIYFLVLDRACRLSTLIWLARRTFVIPDSMRERERGVHVAFFTWKQNENEKEVKESETARK